MTRLSSPLEDIKTRYDVIVIGSGYGGGVAASRMARMRAKRLRTGARQANLLTGDFPARFPDMKNELYIHGKKHAIGSETASVRFLSRPGHACADRHRPWRWFAG